MTLNNHSSILHCIEKYENLEFIQSSACFELLANNAEKDSKFLYNQLAQIFINYHSSLSYFAPTSYWPGVSLHFDNSDFRSLGNIQQRYILSEENKINEAFRAHMANDLGKIIISMFYANYWIRSVDGFRVCMWLYRGILHLQKICTVSDSLLKIKDSFKEMILSSLEISPYEKTIIHENAPTVYIEFHNISNFIENELKIMISNENKNFIPNYRSLLFLDRNF